MYQVTVTDLPFTNKLGGVFEQKFCPGVGNLTNTVTASFATHQVCYIQVCFMFTTYVPNSLLSSYYHSIILLPRPFRTNILF